jgi:DNA-binding PadR family transcriptional regulator
MPDTLKPHWYYMLLSLAGGARHGLAVARDVREFSGNRVRLWPATLYGSLEELATLGWIEEIDDGSRHRPDASERKRYYGLTRDGHAALATETERLASLVKLARGLSRKLNA